MSECQYANPLVEASVKLCSAVKKYRCLYEKYSYRKTTTPECEAAWELVAIECKETVEFCKTRWKTLRRCFFDGLNRRGNKYYLHEYLDFLEDLPKDPKGKRNVIASSGSKIKPNIRNNLERSTDNKLENIINIYDDEDDARSISSLTTSADELNDITQQSSQMGVFIIDEIGDNTENATAADDRRLSYKRSCKRPLDPELIDELVGDQEKSEEKRLRKSVVEKYKTLPNESDNSSFTSHQTIKYKNRICKVETHKGNMVDRFTWTGAKETRNFATQYESNSQEFDDIFLQSIKTQLQEMNPRQKMNFKRKIYQSLLEVFDDATDFPKINEILQLPNRQAPRVINSTVGELRLMRELVSLVQAAKNTPEIMNANENVKTSTTVPIKQPLTMPVPVGENHSKTQTSPQSLSSSLDDDDDLQMSTDNGDDDVILTRSWDQIKAKPTESPKSKVDDTIKGLPRHVLQKVVKVSGSGTSTIVTRDGDRKRIYRIYPKLINQNANESCPTKPASNCGTFFVPSSKKLQDTAANSIKINSSVSGITIRSVNNKPINNTSESTSSVNKSINISNTATNDQTIFKNIHPANRILCASTGAFKSVRPDLTHKSFCAASTGAATSSTSTKEVTAKSPKSPMLPPTSNIANKRNDAVRLGPQIMQRRFSICCPLPANSAETASKNGSSVQNGNSQENSSVSKIKISQPVSLNNKVGNGGTPSSTQNAAPIGNVKTSVIYHQSNSFASARVAVTSATIVPKQEEIQILETAGTVEADVLDPLFVKATSIKSEPVDE